MDRSKINLLVVDDERGLCAGVQEALRREGYAVDAANDARSALQLLDKRLYNLVLTDVRMPEMSGLQLFKEARQTNRDTLFILMTAYGTVESAVEAMREGAYDYLTKPLDMQRLRALVLKASSSSRSCRRTTSCACACANAPSRACSSATARPSAG